MSLLLTSGKRADTPYRLEWFGRNIYSIEELCYCIEKSAQFIDNNILDAGLVSWLGDECALPELARTLGAIITGGDGAVPDFCEQILKTADFLPEKNAADTISIIRAGEGLEAYEQMEARADYLMDSGRFYQALAEYEPILDELPEAERKLRARIEHSRGVIFAGLYNFSMAAECFQRAYTLSDEKKYYLDYLAAIRMYLPDTDYVSFVTRHPESYEYSLELEKMMDEAGSTYDDQPGTKQIEHLREMKKTCYPDQQFDEEIEATVKNLRDNYRTNVSRMA
jgi:tetratricopeptide (TPR) repeat protein